VLSVSDTVAVHVVLSNPDTDDGEHDTNVEVVRGVAAEAEGASGELRTAVSVRTRTAQTADASGPAPC